MLEAMWLYRPGLRYLEYRDLKKKLLHVHIL